MIPDIKKSVGEKKMLNEKVKNILKERSRGVKMFLDSFYYCPQCKAIDEWDTESQYCYQCDKQFYKKLINLTSHNIDYKQKDGSVITIEPSGQEARIKTKLVSTQTLYKISIDSNLYTEVENLPPSREDVLYIVSLPIALALRNLRKDLIVPKTIRDKSGRVIGCDGFSRPL